MSIFVLLFFLTLNTHADDVRIVSLNPTLTEILFDLNLGDKIVGTTTFSDYPEQAKKIPVVGSYLKPSIEKIIELRPTHVLDFKEGDPAIKEMLTESHLDIKIFDNLRLEGFPEIISSLGTLFHKEKEARQILKTWKHQIALLENKKHATKKIMIEVDHNPIYVAGHDTFLSEIFEKCGLKNVFSNIDGFKHVSEESVMNRKPDIILVLGQLHEQMDFESVRTHWKNNPATKDALVLNGLTDELSRLGPRLPLAALQICSQSDLK